VGSTSAVRARLAPDVLRPAPHRGRGPIHAERRRDLVELEHRGWERLGPEVAELKGEYAAGWIATLERFRAAAEEA